jgi:hypothetical protein
MPDYSKSKIYKVVCDETNLTYYGSTIQSLYKRLYHHKRFVNKCKTKDMINPKIYLVEDFPCERKEQLLQRERWYIENNECCNKCIPTRTKEEIIDRQKEYYQKNKEKRKEYRKNNKEEILEYQKEYQQANKQKIIDRQKEYYQKNKEKRKEYMKQLYLKKKQ